MENEIERNTGCFQSPKPVPHILLWLHRIEGKGWGNTILSFCKVLRKSAEIYPDPQICAEDIQFLHSVEKQANIRMSALMSSYLKKKKKDTSL